LAVRQSCVEHPIEEGVVLGGESIPDHLKLEAGRQKHLADVIGSPLCFAFRDELRKFEVGRVKANPPDGDRNDISPFT
jgi:hypothetical protein